MQLMQARRSLILLHRVDYRLGRETYTKQRSCLISHCPASEHWRVHDNGTIDPQLKILIVEEGTAADEPGCAASLSEMHH